MPAVLAAPGARGSRLSRRRLGRFGLPVPPRASPPGWPPALGSAADAAPPLRLPLRQVALLRAAFLDQLLQRADGLEQAVTPRCQDRRAGLVEDLPLHGQALDLRRGGGKEADAARFGGGDFFRTEVQETTLKLSQEGAAQTGSAQQMGRPTCGIQPHYYQYSADDISPEAAPPGSFTSTPVSPSG